MNLLIHNLRHSDAVLPNVKWALSHTTVSWCNGACFEYTHARVWDYSSTERIRQRFAIYTYWYGEKRKNELTTVHAVDHPARLDQEGDP